MDISHNRVKFVLRLLYGGLNDSYLVSWYNYKTVLGCSVTALTKGAFDGKVRI